VIGQEIFCYKLEAEHNFIQRDFKNYVRCKPVGLKQLLAMSQQVEKFYPWLQLYPFGQRFNIFSILSSVL
jgi:hypothetical protein